uniref:U3 small nucleolar RNA-associated protein 4 homolog n=1 Tax=Sinocyclocheilus rhinocerous TaxID=307959 RepID=A0A673M0C2_9TELE
MGEFKVHRVRFFDYMPSGIRALAFNRDTERMAVARMDGSVEIFHCSDRFFQEKIIPGREQCGIEGLSWVGERLFSAGLNGGITEYDLTNQKVKYTIDAYGGPIWTITGNQQGTHLAVGCEDGTVKLFEVNEDKIQFERNLDRQKSRIVSLSWHPSGSKIAAGMMDMIQIFNVETGHSIHRMLADRGVGTSRSKECVVWSVVYLSDGTIVSGDSVGMVKLWDDQTGTLIKSHNVTKCDVLALSVSQVRKMLRVCEQIWDVYLQGEDHIRCSAVSPCGEWIVYSTASSLRLYRLHCDNNNVSITKISKLPKVLSSANQLCFSSDSSHLFSASTQSSVHIVSLSQSGCKFVGTLKPKSGSHQAIHLLAASEDGEWLASANSDHEVHIYNLQTRKAHCTVPVYSSAVTAMGIHATTNCLFMMYADQQMCEYSIEQKQYTDWSRTVQRKGLHRLWMERDTPCLNVMFNPQNPSHVILHDTYMLCIIDQSLPLPDDKTQFYNQLTLKSLTEEQRKSHSHAFKVCKTFKDILCVELISDQSLVVVERPLEDVATQLPAPIKQKKFAT